MSSRYVVEGQFEQLTRYLKILDADRYPMKQAIDSLRENSEMKLLQEIALQLRELRSMEQNEWHLSDFLPQRLTFQVTSPPSYANCSVYLFSQKL